MIDPHIGRDEHVATTNKTLRQFAALCFVFFGGLACWQYFVSENETTAYVLGGIGLFLGLLGLAVPQAIRPVFVTAMVVTFPIGWVISRVLLLVLFYAVFTPVALIFRLIGRDALCRRLQPEAETYWTPKAAALDLRSYLRQS